MRSRIPHPGAWLLCLSISACTADKDEGDSGVEETPDTDTPVDTGSDTDTADPSVDADGDGHTSDVDCDDEDAAVHPEAEEVCDGADNDCDQEVDEGVTVAMHLDADADGFGDADQAIDGCGDESGYVEDASDCDDADDQVFPGSHAIEVPGDGVDQDCNGVDACTDLSCDGWPDILIAQSAYSEEGSESELRVFYGSESGYSEERTASLPTQFSSHTTTADLNGDGYLDIVCSEDETFGGWASEPAAWIFWGSEAGHSETHADSLPVAMSWGTAAFDLDGDAHLELAISSYSSDYEPGFWFYTGSAGGYDSETAVFLPANNMVSQITPADLNHDGIVDLAVAIWGSEGSSIYWGSTEGFEPDNRTDVLTGGYAWDVLVEDFNGDGWPDLLFAHQYGADGHGDFEGTSVVYWGTETGPDLESPTALSTHAAAGACAGDLNSDGYPDAVITELEWFQGTKTGDRAQIFWGGADGLSDDSRTAIDASGPAGCSIYDLNLDGYRDLIIGNQTDGKSYGIDSQIHWGTEAGLETETWTALPTRGVYSVVTHPMEDGY